LGGKAFFILLIVTEVAAEAATLVAWEKRGMRGNRHSGERQRHNVSPGGISDFVRRRESRSRMLQSHRGEHLDTGGYIHKHSLRIKGGANTDRIPRAASIVSEPSSDRTNLAKRIGAARIADLGEEMSMPNSSGFPRIPLQHIRSKLRADLLPRKQLENAPPVTL
jgi:hypothetical protein